MENLNAIILPRVLQMVNNTPNLCESLDHVCMTMKRCLAVEAKGSIRSINVREAVKEALNVAENLGIVKLKENMVRLPFRINSGVEAYNSNKQHVEDESAEDEEVDNDPPATSSFAMSSSQTKKKYSGNFLNTDPEVEDVSSEDEGAEEELGNDPPKSGQSNRQIKKKISKMNDDPEDCYGRGRSSTMRQRRAKRPKSGKTENRSRSRSSRRRGSRRRRS
uniref:Uncharacterized protein n=1 Tax=Stomoxys calcitrans TaxID=35570 RepID=A0A1I8QBE9_STOCA